MSTEATAFKVVLPCEDSMLEMDGLLYDNKLWLVPQWLYNKALGAKKPARMIRFDDHAHQQSPGSPAMVINAPVPRAVLDGKSSDGYETLSGEQITFAIHDPAGASTH